MTYSAEGIKMILQKIAFQYMTAYKTVSRS